MTIAYSLSLPLVFVAVCYMLGVSVVFSTLAALFPTGAYVYAMTGKAPSSFDADLIKSAFREKR